MNPRIREHATRNLSALIITIEFTLISVMIGVVLFPLMDHAQALLRDLRVEYWLYIVSGLLFILYVWTEVISHSLSFIGWPIEFGHNLLYIIFAFALAIQMNFLADPPGWFALTAFNSALATALVLYDRRVIARRARDATGAAAQLYQRALVRQHELARAVPLLVVSGVVNLALVHYFPEFFLAQRAHLLLVSVQIFSIVFLIVRTIRNFSALSELILLRTMEELEVEG